MFRIVTSLFFSLTLISTFLSAPASAAVHNAARTADSHTLIVKQPSTVDWSIPAKMIVTVGFSRQLVTMTPEDADLPALKLVASNKRVKVDKAGHVKGMRAGEVTITVQDATGKRQICAVTVIPNEYSRLNPLYIRGRHEVFSSTKKLYYKNGRLYCEVFVYNRSKNGVRAFSGIDFILVNRDMILVQQPVEIRRLKRTLDSDTYQVYKVAFNGPIGLDLASGRVEAGLTSSVIQHLSAFEPGATRAKGIEYTGKFS